VNDAKQGPVQTLGHHHHLFFKKEEKNTHINVQRKYYIILSKNANK